VVHETFFTRLRPLLEQASNNSCHHHCHILKYTCVVNKLTIDILVVKDSMKRMEIGNGPVYQYRLASSFKTDTNTYTTLHVYAMPYQINSVIATIYK